MYVFVFIYLFFLKVTAAFSMPGRRLPAEEVVSINKKHQQASESGFPSLS